MNKRLQEQQRGPGARKIELERRLDANESASGGDRQALPLPAGSSEQKKIEQEEKDECQLDQALADSFPASDPPARKTPTTVAPTRK